MIVLLVNGLEKKFDLSVHVLIESVKATLTDLMHVTKKTLELMLVDHTNTFRVDLTELKSEFAQEVDMLD